MARVKIRFKSHVRAFKKNLTDILSNRLDKAADFARDELTQVLSRQKALPSSSPGSPPAMRSGKLSQSIRWKQSDKLTRHIGTNLKYGLALELGDSGASAPFDSALLIEVSQSRAMAELAKRPAKKRSHRFVVIRGRYYIYRQWRRGIKPRPWLKITFMKMRRRIGRMVSQPIRL